MNNLTLKQKLKYSRVCWYWGIGAAVVLFIGTYIFAYLLAMEKNIIFSFIIFIFSFLISRWGLYHCLIMYLSYLRHKKEYHRVRQMCLDHPDHIPRSILYAWKRNYCMIPMANDLAKEFEIDLVQVH
jgi:hypothetical protein